MPRTRFALIVLAAVLLGTAPPSNYCISRATLVSQVSSGALAWKTSAPSGWATDNTMVTYADFTANVNTNGNCVKPAGSTLGLMSWAQMINCAVTSTSHSPILANNTFSGGSSTSWTLTNSCGTGYTQSVLNATDEDGDSGYYDFGASGASGVSGCSSTIAQTFSISGAPTNGSISFYYRATAPAATGDTVNCASSNINGAANVKLVINGTTIPINGQTLDGAWHPASVSVSVLVNGSNTVTFQTSASAAESDTYNSTVQACRIPTYANSSMDIDNVVLTATY